MTAFSQQKSVGEDPMMAAIRKDIEAAYAPLEAALKADKALADRLAAELKTASSEKDPARRKAALAAYASKYAAEYGKFAIRSGLQTDKVVASLNARYKDFAFSPANTYGIVMRKKRAKVPRKGGKSTPAPATRTVRLSFNTSRESNCGAVSGHHAHVSERSLDISNWSAVAGGCRSGAELKYAGDLPATARSIILRLGYTITAEGSAVGVLGSSSSTASADVTVKLGTQLLDDANASIYGMAFAPFLWAAGFDDGEDLFTDFDLTAQKGQRLSIIADVFVTSISAICCGTGASAVTRVPIADLEVTD